jgi:hypothetical protein
MLEHHLEARLEQATLRLMNGRGGHGSH